MTNATELAELQRALQIDTSANGRHVLLHKEVDPNKKVQTLRVVNFFYADAESKFDDNTKSGYELVSLYVGNYASFGHKHDVLYAVFVKYRADA